jgi:hypothetical protein
VRRWCAVTAAAAGFVICGASSVGQVLKPAQSQNNQKDSGDENIVTVVGCPVHGVEAGCMVLTDKQGAVWEIGSAKPRPKVGYQAIKVTGRKSRGPSTCMQGTRLESIQWNYTGDQCPEAK